RLWAVGAELAHLFVLVTIIGTLATLLGVLGYAIWLGLGWLWSANFAEGMRFAAWADSMSKLQPTLANVLGVVALVVSAAGLTRFIKVYLGDVQFWCTYEETDEKHVKRRAILDEATVMLEHVLRDERCARVVVVAHSLGTAIAMDALLQLGRYN